MPEPQLPTSNSLTHDPSDPPEENLEQMGFLGHFDELRTCLFKAVVGTAIMTIAALTQIKTIWGILLWPLPTDAPLSLQNIAPTEGIYMDFKVAILSGIMLGSPFIFWQAYKFFAPALFSKERKLVWPLVTMSVVFFLGGGCFAFLVVLPASFQFLQAYSTGISEQQWTQSNYLGFVMRMILAFAVMFQMPVVTFLLSKLKLITAHFLISQARIAIVMIFVLAAVLTPPEIISQMMLALPLIVLYGLSIVIAMFTNPQSKPSSVTEHSNSGSSNTNPALPFRRQAKDV